MKFFEIIAMIISVLSQSLSFAFLNNKIKSTKFKYKKVLFLSLLFIWYLLVYLVIPSQFRFILSLIINSTLRYLVLKNNIRESITISILLLIFYSASEILISLILILLNMNTSQILNNIYLNVILNVLISFVTILVVSIPTIKRLLIQIVNYLNKNKKYFNYLICFIALLYLLIAKNGLDFVFKSSYYLTIIIFIVILLVSILIVKKDYEQDKLKEINQQTMNFVKKYEKIITEQGKANHEYKNQLMVIKGYAKINTDKLIDYIDSVIEDTKKAGSSYLISQLNKFPDGGIKGLLYYKLSVMEDNDIKYEINVETNVKNSLNKLSTKSYKKITKALGILLDNAIDAAKLCKNKKILITVIKDKNKIIFSIYNTFNGKINLNKIGTGYTTKGRGHGYGLQLLNDMIGDDDKFSISKDIDKEYYVSKLSIKIK